MARTNYVNESSRVSDDGFFFVCQSFVSDITVLNKYLLTSQRYMVKKGWEELQRGD